MPTDTHDLIAAIYAATLSPSDFHRVFDNLDSLLFLGEDSALDRKTVLSDVALSHIDMARSIQERIGNARTQHQKLAAIVEAVPNPSYIVSKTEAVVAANAMASTKYGPAPASLKNLIAVGDVQKHLRDYLRRDGAGAPMAIAGQSDPSRKGQTSVIISRIDAEVTGGIEHMYLLSIIDFGFDEAVTELFRAAYGLTHAECQVAVLVASGLRLTDIAVERDVALDTVRSQIKTIKNKTSTRDLPALVRLLCGFSASVAAQNGRQGGDIRANPAAPMKIRRQISLKSGRQLDFVEQGAADGKPVLMFHNLPYGVELPTAAIKQAHAEGLRFIAPFRPGMGATDYLQHANMEELLDKAADDCEELLRHRGVSSVVAVSHAAGSPFALRFASRYPERVSRLIGVSQAPGWRPEFIHDLPQRQRFVVRLAKHFPQVLPVVAWSMIACLDSPYATEFVRHGCRDGRADSRAVEDQEIVDLIAQGSVDALKRGVAGFCQECLIIQRNAVEEARRSPHKFHILHGDDDRIIPLAHSRAFVENVPGTTIEIIKDAGQLLFFSHWRHVFDAITKKRRHMREPEAIQYA
ncbi:pimeloyl-ACP methyl ester carboxylesterase/DNA-binding CsgD family transcriptional regulator [Rhizobium sp. SG_E_25_P2]|uniref:alpha/beta hydrolase n=1 Tax=Rhizobium sp. SG_E_25_P2 TaxID=2879942 RepID=UPI0024770C37|nr:alpha/beta hydrolase [Rhizobium sp. SG_E_25_P2]MDH6266202.1 pimeloyl-ACP methyl ester carboxylesterase/DNA-binding CsgD family transcriptional regulator [Rhizobium sp. SG_E_25_P2]